MLREKKWPYWCKSNNAKRVIRVRRSSNIQKTLSPLSLHRVDLKVSLKESEKNASYHFSRIFVLRGSHLCDTKRQKVLNLRGTKSQWRRQIGNFNNRPSFLSCTIFLDFSITSLFKRLIKFYAVLCQKYRYSYFAILPW